MFSRISLLGVTWILSQDFIQMTISEVLETLTWPWNIRISCENSTGHLMSRKLLLSDSLTFDYIHLYCTATFEKVYIKNQVLFYCKLLMNDSFHRLV